MSSSSRYAVQSYISGPSRSTIPHHTSIITPSTPIFFNVRNEISSAVLCCSAPSREMTSSGSMTNTGVGDLAYSKSCATVNDGGAFGRPEDGFVSASASEPYNTDSRFFLPAALAALEDAFVSDSISGVGNETGASDADTPWLRAERWPLRAIFCASAGER